MHGTPYAWPSVSVFMLPFLPFASFVVEMPGFPPIRLRSEVVKKLIQSPKNLVFLVARGGVLPYLGIFSQPLRAGSSRE